MMKYFCCVCLVLSGMALPLSAGTRVPLHSKTISSSKTKESATAESTQRGYTVVSSSHRPETGYSIDDDGVSRTGGYTYNEQKEAEVTRTIIYTPVPAKKKVVAQAAVVHSAPARKEVIVQKTVSAPAPVKKEVIVQTTVTAPVQPKKDVVAQTTVTARVPAKKEVIVQTTVTAPIPVKKEVVAQTTVSVPVQPKKDAVVQIAVTASIQPKKEVVAQTTVSTSVQAKNEDVTHTSVSTSIHMNKDENAHQVASSSNHPGNDSGSESHSHDRLARVTAYWSSEGDYYTGRGISATGVRLHDGHCAVDPSIIPYGSIVEVEGMGRYLAVDTGTAVINRTAAREGGHNSAERHAIVIDLYFESSRDGERFASAAARFVNVTWWTPSTADLQARARSLFADENWTKIQSKQL